MPVIKTSAEIYKILKQHKDMAFINEDGTKLYAYAGRRKMIVLSGPDFSTMDEAAINAFICSIPIK